MDSAFIIRGRAHFERDHERPDAVRCRHGIEQVGTDEFAWNRPSY
jgi:hypothetical protein